jgi:hypothetical protein
MKRAISIEFLLRRVRRDAKRHLRELNSIDRQELEPDHRLELDAYAALFRKIAASSDLLAVFSMMQFIAGEFDGAMH